MSEVTQLCPTLSDPMDCSLPGSSVHGIFPGKSTGVGRQRKINLEVNLEGTPESHFTAVSGILVS